ncbi:GIY-YIG nuclease family protein, partial [Vibrio azureus]
SLYLFEYQLGDGSIIHKVGRTSRQPEQRLKETVQDLEKATDQSVVKSKILRVVANCGHVEQYVFHRY